MTEAVIRSANAKVVAVMIDKAALRTATAESAAGGVPLWPGLFIAALRGTLERQPGGGMLWQMRAAAQKIRG